MKDKAKFYLSPPNPRTKRHWLHQFYLDRKDTLEESIKIQKKRFYEGKWKENNNKTEEKDAS